MKQKTVTVYKNAGKKVIPVSEHKKTAVNQPVPEVKNDGKSKSES